MNSHHHETENPGRSGERLASSFRDPSGFVFSKSGALYRQVNKVYAANYDRLMSSGLYDALAGKGFLIPHEEVSGAALPAEGHKLLRPSVVPFISYPYEWSFSELKDAALLTLKIQKIALQYGMVLKDASAYNIQFWNGRPILIDTLSFEQYHEGAPWVAYRQFCEHFLAPLTLMSFLEIRLGQLLRVYPNGISLDLASKLLPWRSWFSPVVFFHIHMHAKSQRRYREAKSVGGGTQSAFDRSAMEELVRHLRLGVAALCWKPQGTEWDEYYAHTNYSESAAEEKLDAVKKFIEIVRPKTVWDIGANEGRYSRVASERGIETVAFDIDPASVEKNYGAVTGNKEEHLLPLLLDITNPSPALGWANQERESLTARGPADLVLALALIHHLSITNNVPFELVAEFFAKISRALVIEFVPKDDSQVERLLKNRADIFAFYTKEHFEKAFRRHFALRATCRISGSKRVLYLMTKR